MINRGLGDNSSFPTLFIYIPTFNRPDWLEMQLSRLSAQFVKYPGRVRVLVSNNLPEDHSFKIIAQKFKCFKEIEFRENPGNILGNANITLGFIFARSDEFLWVLSDDDLILPTALDSILPNLLPRYKFLHIGDYQNFKSFSINRNNIFTKPSGAGFGLISVVIFYMPFVKNDIYNGFEYIDSSFPHLAIALASLRRFEPAEVLSIPANLVFSFEGALTDGDYSQSQLGYAYLADFLKPSMSLDFIEDWLSVGWLDFYRAKTVRTALNNNSRFYKACGYIASHSIKLRLLLIIFSQIYRIRSMLKKIYNRYNQVLKKLHELIKNIGSLGNNGERLDFVYRENLDFNNLDVYEKSHLKRYQFASELLEGSEVVGDMACGTGYGSIILSKRSKKVLGFDISKETIKKITKRYKGFPKVNFKNQDLLNLEYLDYFDSIISFETVEHLYERDIPKLFNKFSKALKSGGMLVISTPYMQETPPPSVQLNHHLTHEIDEVKICEWLNNSGFKVKKFYYQNYIDHKIIEHLNVKDMIICIAIKL